MYTFLIFLISLCPKVGSASTNITSTQFLKDPNEITSSNDYFKLGFFSPPNSTNRYVGIWFNTGSDALEIVWVANKDNPLKGSSSGVLRLSSDGNLQVSDGENKVFWSSNTTQGRVRNTRVAQLQDNGNLVLLDRGLTIWQSFEHPSDSIVPSMGIGIYNHSDSQQQVLRSWKSPSDPSNGRFTLGITPSRQLFEVFIWDEGRPFWRTGPWNGNLFIGLPITYSWGLVDAFKVESNNQGQPFIRLKQPTLAYYVLRYDGVLVEREPSENSKQRWEAYWSSTGSDCDVYGKCGSFGVCNPREWPICSCLAGFEPTDSEEWGHGNWTRGCSRRRPLQCDAMKGNMDGFLRTQNIKVPDHAESLYVDDVNECGRECQQRCSCLAYAFNLGIGCMIWNHTLIDIQAFNVTAIDLFVRLAHSEITGRSNRIKRIVVIVVLTWTITFVILTFFVWKWKKKRRGAKRNDLQMKRGHAAHHVSDVELKDLPLFEFEKLEVATNFFNQSNKLGQGGFGPVFKGKLEDGQEIAVKRLSRSSGQGLKEFMNEVLLISKLQHRNLVRLLGCSVEREEKLLVYEYMPNKSLDALLFDPLHQKLLNWKTRFKIIEGICRALLYLHRDSRLKIIHRDLKASNILLDEDLNPKISDFGMAKIFGSKEEQGNTTRVVGTYGYMSPEYAMEGRFSEKSDVYSFGVLLLEIVCGKRNTSFKDDHECLSLLGHVWRLWNEDDVLSLVDPSICTPCSQEEVFKCIQLGLLCVQEFPEDRPSISTVISVLDSEIHNLPYPMQPGFIGRDSLANRITPSNATSSSVNDASVTILSGR